MLTTDFAANLAAVIKLARTDRVALMCAEALPPLADRRRFARALRHRLRDRKPEAPAGSQANAVCPRSGQGNHVPVRRAVSGFAWRMRGVAGTFKAGKNMTGHDVGS